MEGNETPQLKHSSIVYENMKRPELLRLYMKMNSTNSNGLLDVAGSSPTDIFIGSYNYPKVFIGPLVPRQFGDTSILAMPERWKRLSIPEIMEMRTKLVRGTYVSSIKNVENGRIEEQIRDLALADSSSDVEMEFSGNAHFRPMLDDYVEPFGPTGKIKTVATANIRANRIIEKSYSDTDALASTSIMELYRSSIPISKIESVLSAGLIGLKGKRKFVPTRWSITAVDDIISKGNLKEIKGYGHIDSIYAYFHVSLDTRWLIFFIPGNWQYEVAEAWYPHTVWTSNASDISIEASYEGYEGKKAYAEIGGSFYAARVAVTEKLMQLKRQGMVLILREVHEGYALPVGVWNVREHVREALETKPDILHNVSEMFEYINHRMAINANGWAANTRMLKDLLMQRRISYYSRNFSMLLDE